MKAVWYEALGAANEVLQFGEVDDPQPAAGQVRVRLSVSGVNPIDTKRRLGGRGEMTAPRIIPHFDGAGVIDEVGEGVDPSRVGQRVWVYKAQWLRDFGTAAEYVCLRSECAVPLPDEVDFAEGACLGIPALTAYPSVFADGPVEGKQVLVSGGAGSVGRYAVQFAKLGGATVLTTVSSEEKAELARSAGADHLANYREDDLSEWVEDLTDGNGVDRIVEVEFGGNLTFSLEAIKSGGIIATYASQAVPEPAFPFYAMMYKAVVLRHVLTFLTEPELECEAVARISEWLAAGKLSHHIGQRFPLTETIAAHEAVEAGAVGKVLVDV